MTPLIHFTLFLIIQGNVSLGGGTSVAVTNAVFDNKILCERAAKDLLDNSKGVYLIARCEQSDFGGPGDQ